MCASPAGVLAWVRSAVAAALITGVYFAVPLPTEKLQDGSPELRVVACLAGVIVLAWLLGRQVGRALRPGRSLAEQLAMLLTVVIVVVVFFATLYFLMAAQFHGLRTRVDALYFSVITLGTVGYGDVVPLGQGAKALVVVQVIFDLIVVTSALALIVGVWRSQESS
ncbi:potassium channel family protein [Nonomuraea sp. NPDC049758]|uniref:potassium channel family protein n=1 Tax=Nonomuraea sp. NPDC049758 TaxID=3154360 RepID=UPI00342375A2